MTFVPLLLALMGALPLIASGASNLAKIVNDDAGNLIVNATLGRTVIVNGVDVEKLAQQVWQLSLQVLDLQSTMAELKSVNADLQQQLQSIRSVNYDQDASLALDQAEINIIFPGTCFGDCTFLIFETEINGIIIIINAF